MSADRSTHSGCVSLHQVDDKNMMWQVCGADRSLVVFTMPKTYTLTITLIGSEPAIWRKVAVSGDITLEHLHRVIQISMGWMNSHLHRFMSKSGGWSYSDPRFDLDNANDEFEVTLQKVAPKKGSSFIYNYDFGDDWNHLVAVEQTETVKVPVLPQCIAGERACPPEDVGGVWGYQEFLEAIADPQHERHEEFNAWAPAGFHPEKIDIAAINRELDDPEAMSWSDEDEWVF